MHSKALKQEEGASEVSMVILQMTKQVQWLICSVHGLLNYLKFSKIFIPNKKVSSEYMNTKNIMVDKGWELFYLLYLM